MVILNWTAETVEVESDGEYRTDVVLCVNGDLIARKEDVWVNDDPDRIADAASELLREILRRVGGES